MLNQLSVAAFDDVNARLSRRFLLCRWACERQVHGDDVGRCVCTAGRGFHEHFHFHPCAPAAANSLLPAFCSSTCREFYASQWQLPDQALVRRDEVLAPYNSARLCLQVSVLSVVA